MAKIKCDICNKEHEPDKCGLKPKKKKADKQARIDFTYAEVPQSPEEKQQLENFLNDTFKSTAEGFLKGIATVTNVGVFPYKMADGSIQWELRPPEEVFARASMDSLKMKPLTNDHPKLAVVPETVKKLAVGSLGDSVETGDAYRLNATVVITDAKAIEEVKLGKRAFSCGYNADVEQTSGVWMGVPYDAIQRNIRYNHVAIVDRGRAGDDAVIKLDSAESGEYKTGVMTMDAAPKKIKQENNNLQEDTIVLKKIKIDGIEYEAETDVIKAFTQSQTRNDELEKQVEEKKTENSQLQAKVDTLEETKTDLETKISEAKKLDPTKINDAVNARIELIQSAEKAGIEIKEDMNEVDIKKAIILKAFPKAAEKLDKADEVYISARYDGAVEHLAEVENTSASNKEKANGSGENHQDNSDEINSDKSHEKMVQSMEDAWKPKTK